MRIGRKGIPAAAVTGMALALAAPAAAQPARMPDGPGSFVAMLRKADTGNTGFVTRRQLDGPLAEVQAAQAARVDVEWARLTSFMRVPEDTPGIETGAVVDEILRMLGEADADKDGKVTREEIDAYVAKEADPVRREAIRERLTAVDTDRDGTVSEAERRIEIPDEVRHRKLSKAERAEQTKGTSLWQGQAIDKLFAIYADPEGRIDIAKLEEQLKTMMPKLPGSPPNLPPPPQKQ